MTIKQIGLSLFFLLSFTFGLAAQSVNGSIRGNVYDKETGEPIAFGNVRLSGTTIGTTTNLEGFYTITNITPGTYKLVATYVGYDSTAVEVQVRADQNINKQLYISAGGISLGVVEVNAEKQIAKTEVKVSAITITPKQIQALPSIGGEADIAQYLPVLPGVIFTGDQGGQLYIRGGSPVQNKILLDGMTIVNPFHSLGFFSVFETEAIRSVDVLTGGFSAEYGGRISAVVDIKTREGNKKRYGGVISANPFQSKILLEGPIKKLKDEGGGSTSFILTGKHSYIDQTSPTLYSYATDSVGLPFSFTDLYGKVSFVAENGSKLNLFGMNFTDRVNYEGIANIDWKINGGGANFKLIPNSSDFLVGGAITYSDYKIQLEEGNEDPRFSGITSYSAGLNFTYFGANNEVNYGFQFTGFNTNFKFRNFLGLDFEQNDFTTEIAAFVKYRQVFGDLVFEPSVRVQYYASQADFSLEPRLGLKYNVGDNFRLKFAGGLYSQNLISTVNERDIVNLFVGFLSGPEEKIFKPGTTIATDHRLQKSVHAIFGAEFDITRNIEFNVEPYFKGFTQLININRNKLAAEDPDFSTETGDAFGIDFFLKYTNPKWYVWLTYSLGYVNRFDGFQTYPTIFDRRHNVNVLLTHNWGGKKLNNWEASVRWNMGSGFPFTLTQGFYDREDLLDGVSSDYLTDNGRLGIIYDDERNSGRLPYYHRLDMSIKRTFEFDKFRKLETVVSVTNAYNRKNIFFFDRVRYERVNQLPILPSLGIIFTF